MKLLSILFCSALVALAAPACAQDAKDVASAQEAARGWLAQLDAGQYGESWDNSALAFQGAVSKPAWEAAMQSMRTPLGAVKTRTLKSATYANSPPGAPAGEYVVVQYSTDFAGAAAKVETVTPMRDKNREWKVSGYFVK